MPRAKIKTKSERKAVNAQRVKNANVISCRPSVASINALRAEAASRGVTYSRMAALVIEERYLPATPE